MISAHLQRIAQYLTYLICVLMLANTASASVTILGSRIIYPAGASSVDVQLKNNDDIPYVIQTWFDEGDVNATPAEGAKIPFLTTPPVFRIQAKAGQVIRVTHTGARDLPQDRESLYWFNALQVPPSNLESEKGQNKMLVMLRTRVKVIYRPAGIGTPKNQLKGLRVSTVFDAQKGYGISIENPQPWYASLTLIEAEAGGKKHTLTADTVAPFDRQTFWFNNWKTKTAGNGTVRVWLVNDQGARINGHYPVSYP
ncbi:fimbria/pilus periplasmic chaperone [Enterobacter chuandaensis]|uniref:fimbria/pilus periplasmic chaperone n=1 Tax=Enterobacter chuandaensis TaxID=2497875 RepID=UPI002FD76927